MPAILIFCVIENAVGSPSAFFVHRTRSEILYVLLNILGFLLSTYKDAIGTGSNNYIMDTIDKMVERLEEFDDVRTVYTNMKPAEE